MTASGRSREIAPAAAMRAARAHTRSVSASVRTERGGVAAASVTVAPARCRLAASSASEARRPTVEPSETSRTRVIGVCGDRGSEAARSCRAAALVRQVGLEAGRPAERDRPQRRGLLDVKADPVAALDRDDRAVLLAPGERTDDREAGRDGRDLRREQREAAGGK